VTTTTQDLTRVSDFERGRASGAWALANALEQWAQTQMRIMTDGRGPAPRQAVASFMTVLPAAVSGAWAIAFAPVTTEPQQEATTEMQAGHGDPRV
jgi:hypothetical protein